MKIFSIACKILLSLTIVLLFSENYLTYKGVHIDVYQAAFFPVPVNLKDAHRVCGWVAKPGDSPCVEDSSIIERVWPNGQRASRKVQNKSGKIKVLILGCSYSYGMGVNNEDTFAWKLNEAFPNIVFDNYSVKAYSTYQCSMLMEHLLKSTHYDLVIYGCMKGHFSRNDSPYFIEPLHVRTSWRFSPWVELNDNGGLEYHNSDSYHWPFENKLLTVTFLKRVYLGMKMINIFDEKQKRTTYKRDSFQTIGPDQLKILELLLIDMNKIAKKYNTKLITVSLDEQTNNYLKKISQNTKNLPPIIDISTHLLETPQGHVKNDLHNHPSSPVHQYWAEQLIIYLRKNGY